MSLLFANPRACIAGLLAGLSVANGADTAPAGLAAHLEATLVSGAGILFPDASQPGTLHVGSVVLDDSWPAAFLAHAGETVEVSVSPETGWYEFRDAAGYLFWVEIPAVPLTTDWIAPALRPGADPASAALLSPFRLTETWRLSAADDAETRDPGTPGSRSGTPGCRKAGIPAHRSIFPASLAFTAFAVTPTNLLFSVAWPTNDPPDGLPPPGGLLDLYVSTNLASARWTLLHTESGATNPPVAFSIPGPAVPGWGASAPAHVHDATCPAVTNVVLSPLDGETVYTNVAYLCVAPAPATEVASFRLGIRADSDADGLPDAYERFVAGSDPGDALDALADPDGDGLPNVYEWTHGTDPRAPDWDAAPRRTVGGHGADFATLSAAFAASEPYDILEIRPGVYSGSGWTGLAIPVHPVLVTSPDGGRRKGVVLRGTGGLGVLFAPEGSGHHMVVQGLSVELSATATWQSAFFWGASAPLPGHAGATGCFRNVDVHLGSGAGTRVGWFVRHSLDDHPLILAGCVVDAGGASSARGVYAVDSPPLLLENCTFREFPDAELTPAYAVQLESTASNMGDASDPIPATLRNCLFDASFTNALALAPLTNGVRYAATMDRCLVPSAPEYPPSSEAGTVAASVAADRHGHLPSASSPAVGSGTAPRFAVRDIDGEPFAATPSIGADEWSDGLDVDSDGDGLPNADELLRSLTDPFLADTDGDTLPDGVEDAHGTDPNDPESFCMDIQATVRGVPIGCPGLGLVLAVPEIGDAWRTVSQTLPAVSAMVAAYDFGHVCVSGAPPSGIRLVLFHDPQGAQAPDASNAVASVALSLSGHDPMCEVSFDGAVPDEDSDGMPDLWEDAHGLCPTNALDAAANQDGDGLVNLHEYWAGCDPWTPDGFNTLLSSIAMSIDSRIAGVTNAALAKPMYNNYVANGAQGIFERNTDCWAYGIDLSCTAIWKTNGERNKRCVTLISPRHVLGATHFGPRPGHSYTFQSMNGTTFTRSIVATNCLSDTDIVIGLLDSEIPPDVIAPAKLLPPNYPDFIKTGRYLPVVAMDQEKKALVYEVKDLNATPSPTTFDSPSQTARSPFYEEAIVGDSGHPLFLVINTDAVLLGSFWTGFNSPGTPETAVFHEQIQAAMDLLARGYSLTFFDFCAVATSGEYLE